VRKGGRISGIHQLAEHFVEGQNLGGVVRGEAEKMTQESGFGHRFHLQNIPGECCLDQAVIYIVGPE
jgi:hypothetical protein